MNSNCEKHTINMGCCEPVMVWADASDYYTKQEVNQKLLSLDAKNLDVEDFDAYSASTKDTIDAVSGDVISEHDRAVAAENALNDQIVSATSGMATQEWVENQGYLTEHQSLSGYATEQWVEDQGYLTEHQSLSGYATEQWVLDKNYITGVDLSNYALKSEIPTVPTSNTAFTNDAGYITNDALNGYAESTAVTQEISAAVSGKTNQSDFSAHTANTTVHITSTERNTWNAKADVWVGDETAWSQISGNTQQGVIYLVTN